MEIWKSIKGYEGRYEISNSGSVRSLLNSYGRAWDEGFRIRKTYRHEYGYEMINLFKNGKSERKKISRLVAESFLPNHKNLPVVNHKDSDVYNDNVENLEWCTYSYNNCHAHKNNRKLGRQKITFEDAMYIRSLDRDEYPTWMIACFSGLSCGSVCQICAGTQWKAKNYEGIV